MGEPAEAVKVECLSDVEHLGERLRDDERPTVEVDGGPSSGTCDHDPSPQINRDIAACNTAEAVLELCDR